MSNDSLDQSLPDNIQPVEGIPASAMRAANALLADMIGKREWDVPCAAGHIVGYVAEQAKLAGHTYTREDVQKWRDDVAHACADMVERVCKGFGDGDWSWLINNLRSMAKSSKFENNKQKLIAFIAEPSLTGIIIGNYHYQKIHRNGSNAVEYSVIDPEVKEEVIDLGPGKMSMLDADKIKHIRFTCDGCNGWGCLKCCRDEAEIRARQGTFG